MISRSWTLLEILNETSSFFLRRGLENPRLQAELLLIDVLELRRVDLYLQFERLLTGTEVDAYREHVRRRARGVPLQYITGSAGFRELILSVPEGVLIPRPETEVVTGVALELLDDRPARVLDLGSGSGAIAVSLAHEHRQADVVAVDLSPEAVLATRTNAALAGVEDRVQVLQGDLYTALEDGGTSAPFDLIVSNPPYVRHDDMAALEPEVREHEPHLALDGGTDGLDLYRRITAAAPEYLATQGHLVLELGDTLSEAVSDLVAACPGLELVQIRADLSDVPRVLVARCAAN